MLSACARVGLRAAFGAKMAPVRPSASGARGVAAAAAATVEAGDTVAVHYTGTLDDGSVFDSSRQPGREPLEFKVGSGMVIKGFDKVVSGLAVGDTNKLRVEPADAYGEWDERMVVTVPADKAPEGLEPGMMVQLSNGMPALIKDLSDEGVTIDANHQLAGKALTFEVELMDLSKGAEA